MVFDSLTLIHSGGRDFTYAGDFVQRGWHYLYPIKFYKWYITLPVFISVTLMPLQRKGTSSLITLPLYAIKILKVVTVFCQCSPPFVVFTLTHERYHSI